MHLLAPSYLPLPDPRSTISLFWEIVAGPLDVVSSWVWQNSALKGQCWLHGHSLFYGLGAFSLPGPRSISGAVVLLHCSRDGFVLEP